MQVSASALHSENHQLRAKNLNIWCANSSDTAPVMGNRNHERSPFAYVLASNDARTVAADRLGTLWREDILWRKDSGRQPL